MATATFDTSKLSPPMKEINDLMVIFNSDVGDGENKDKQRDVIKNILLNQMYDIFDNILGLGIDKKENYKYLMDDVFSDIDDNKEIYMKKTTTKGKNNKENTNYTIVPDNFKINSPAIKAAGE